MRLGVLVAGGRGARLRLGVPKALAPFAGGTLAEHARSVLESSTDAIVVVAPRFVPLDFAGVERVHDTGDGPLAATVAALAGRRFATAVVFGVDLPFVPAALLRALADRVSQDAVMAAADGREQPLASAWSEVAVARLAARCAAGERAFVAAARATGARAVDVRELGFDPAVLTNVNTAEDLAAAVERLRSGRVA